LLKSIDQSDHIQGTDSALATVVEYGDYQCADTRAARLVVTRLQMSFEDGMRFVFRNFPLTDVHKHAQNAAEAAEAAGVQGMFWEMHEALFQHQDDLSEHVLSECAEEIGLDVDRFEWDMSEHAHASRVMGDIRGGKRSGVQRTPTFFINEAVYIGPIAYEDLRTAIEDMQSLGS
jgi:protein-disulfide isomerase